MDVDTKELKIIDKSDKLDGIAEYVFLKQSSIENTCNLFPKTFYEISAGINKILSHKNDFILAINTNANITGVCIFFNEPDKKYLECLGAFFNDESDFQLLFIFLRKEYKDFLIDFAFPLENVRALKYLKNVNAKFDKSQICMEVIYDTFVRENYMYDVFELSKEFYDSYSKIHSDEDVYWTADRVISASELFKPFIISIEKNIVGYIDVTYNRALNEIYNVYAQNKNLEYIGALINIAVTSILSKGNKIIVLVDSEDSEIINLYKDFGFKETYSSQSARLYPYTPAV